MKPRLADFDLSLLHAASERGSIAPTAAVRQLFPGCQQPLVKAKEVIARAKVLRDRGLVWLNPVSEDVYDGRLVEITDAGRAYVQKNPCGGGPLKRRRS